MGDPLGGYHVGWKDDPEPQDPLQDYSPDWKKPRAAVATEPEPAPAPVVPEPEPPGPAISPAARRGVTAQAIPQFDVRNPLEPLNEAAADVLRARGVGIIRDEEGNIPEEPVGPLEFGQREIIGAGKAVLGTVQAAGQAARMAFTPGQVLAEEDMRRRAAAQAGVAAPPSEPEELVRSLNPLPFLEQFTQGQPEAVGGVLAGPLIGEATGGLFRRRPGTGLEPRSPVQTPEEAAPFQTLGLDPRTATPDDVEAAFRERAKATHPDVPAEERAARGGPTDPIQAAMAFNEASAAKDAALEILGRPRPTQTPQAAPVEPERPQPAPAPTEPVRATPEPPAPPEAPRPAPAPPVVVPEEAPEVSRPRAARQAMEARAAAASAAQTTAAATTAITVPANAEEARQLGSALRDFTLRPTEEWTPEIRQQYQEMADALAEYYRQNPLSPSPPFEESFAGRQAAQAVPPKQTLEEFITPKGPTPPPIPEEPPARPAPRPLSTPETRAEERRQAARPEVTFKKAAIVPTREGVRAVPIEEPDVPALLREHARLDEETAMLRRLKPDGWADRVRAIKDRQDEIERLAPLRTAKPVTPQVPTQPGQKYVLPSFATGGAERVQVESKQTPPEQAPPTEERGVSAADLELGYTTRAEVDAAVTNPDRFTVVEGEKGWEVHDEYRHGATVETRPTEAQAEQIAQQYREDVAHAHAQVTKRLAREAKKGVSRETAATEAAGVPGAAVQEAPPGEPAGQPPGHGEGAGGEGPAPSARAKRGGRRGAGPPVAREALPEGGPVQPEAARVEEAVREQPAGEGERAGPARPGAGAVEGGPAVRGEPGAVGRNYRIAATDRLGAGGATAHARGNLDAIRLLKQLEAEARAATTEEQATLVKYAGWGGLPQMFDVRNKEWGELATELRSLLTDDEYESARASTPNAHYTSQVVIEGIYRALARLGLKDGRFLEPSAGIGHFMGLGPKGVKWTGIELDKLSARILKHLYPKSDIRQGGFEDQALATDFYDGVVSNVPFGDYTVHDPAFNKYGWPIHNYFIAKALDNLKPGGVMAVVTSRYAMDAPSHQPWREYVDRKAELLGAIRLPNTAFKGNAGTEVTTDVLFLQKKPAGAAGESWTLSERREGGFPLNEYFERHPEMMLGTMTTTGTMYGGQEPTLEPHPGEDLGEAIDGAIAKLPADIARPAVVVPTDLATGAIPATGSEPDGSYRVEAGKLQQRRGAAWAEVTGTHAPQIRQMAEIRDAARDVLTTQVEEQPEKVQAAARKKLAGTYDRFVKKYGPLNKRVKSGTGERRPNLEPFRDDPDVSLLAALEEVDDDRGTFDKAAIFTERVIERQPPIKVEKPDDVLLASLNERGRPDLERMAELLGKSPAETREALRGLVYDDPATDRLESADNYLSGNVRAKLQLAREAAKVDERYGENVKALEAVQPEDLAPSEIHVAPGAPWIPTEDVQDFARELLGAGRYGRAVGIQRFKLEAAWKVDAPYEVVNSVASRKEWGTERVPATQLLEDALNQIATTVYDPDPADPEKRVVNDKQTIAAREAQDRIKQRFAEWAFQEEARGTRLARKYNDEFNNYRPAKFDGAHLTLPGSSNAIRLLPHQKDAVWRALQQRAMGLFQAVGAGKTYEMAAMAMEGKRLGLVHKAMHVVPNHMVNQFQRDFLKLYPAARILVADDKSFARAGAAARKEFVARVATGNWDSVIITHSSFSRIPMSKEFEMDFLKQELSKYEEAAREAKAGRNRDMTKLIEKGKKRLLARLKQIENREAKDDLLPFEQLGIDAVFADEAQAYKNLYFMTKMRNVPGAGQLTQRSMDLYLKSRYLQGINGRLVLATGTPISNTISEMFTMQRYLQPDLLAERGIDHFDSWAATFGEARTVLELGPSGAGYRMATRFAYFKNVGELAQLFRQMADVKTAEDLKLPVPKLRGGQPAPVVVPPTDELRAYVQSLVERAAAIKARRVAPEVDNMLKVTHDGRFAALDLRLMDPTVEEPPESKLNAVADKVAEIHKAGAAPRHTQIVFINAVKPGYPKLDVYGELRHKLTERGVPREEIAFIHDAKTDVAKETLFRRVREGKVRVLMGSIAKMGIGTNVQDRLIALHHVDAPWRPSDIEQGDGRILRRGNRNEEVQIYHYLSEGSFDAYIWQMLERKAAAIDQMMKAQAGTRTIEDVDGRALTFAEIKAIATGNPLVMEKAQVDADVQRLARLAATHRDRQFQIKQEMALAPERITAKKHAVAQATADQRALVDVKGDKFTVTVKGDTFTERAAAAAKIETLAKKLAAGAGSEWDVHEIGSFAGLKLVVSTQAAQPPMIGLKGDGLYETVVPETAEGIARALDYLPKRVGIDLENAQDGLSTLEKSQKDLERLRDEPFAKQAELERLAKRQVELNNLLDVSKQQDAEMHREAPDVPDPGTQEATDEPDTVDLEDHIRAPTGRAPDEEPTQVMDGAVRSRLQDELKISKAEADRYTDADLAREALKQGVLDDVTKRDLLDEVNAFLGGLEDERGFAKVFHDDEETETAANATADVTGAPRVYTERRTRGLGIVTNYALPPSKGLERIIQDPKRSPQDRTAAATFLRIVRMAQDAAINQGRLSNEYAARMRHRLERLTKKDKETLAKLADDEKVVSGKDAPAGTSPQIRQALDDHRAASREHWKAMGQADRVQLPGRSRAILEAALTEWPIGTAAPDWETTPVNRRAILEVAEDEGISDVPTTRDEWAGLVQELKDIGRRVAQPAYMDSADLQRIFSQLRGEGGIVTHFPHVFRGPWVVRAGPFTKRFLVEQDATEYARMLLENRQFEKDIVVMYDEYTPEYGTFLTRKHWLSLRSRLAQNAEADATDVGKAMGAAGVRMRPRRRFFAHGKQRAVNLQTFDRDYTAAMSTYHARLARYLAWGPFRKAATDLLEEMPYDGGWRQAAEAYIKDAQGTPGEITESLNRTLAGIPGLGRLVGPQAVAGAARKWQTFVSWTLGGYNPVWPVLHTVQYMTNVPAGFAKDGHTWAWRGIVELLKNSEESRKAVDAAGIRFMHPWQAVGEYFPRGLLGDAQGEHWYSRWWHPMWMFNTALDTMKSAALLAKYYEARGAGLDIPTAQRLATEFLRNTYFDFSATDAPRMMRNPIGRVLGQLQLYGLNQMLYAENLYRRGNWRQRAAFAFHLWAWQGAAALMLTFPFFVANWLLGKTGEFRDKNGRKDTPWGALWDHLGPPQGNRLLTQFKYGIFGLFGINLSDHIGMIGPQGWRIPVPASMLQQAAEALVSPDPRQREAAAKGLAPVAVTRLIRAYEQAREGKVRDRTGRIVQDTVTAGDIARTATGFRSIAQAERQAEIEREREATAEYKNDRLVWMAKAAEAYQSGGWEAVVPLLDQARQEGVYLTGRDVADYLKRANQPEEERRRRALPRALRPLFGYPR